MRAVRIFDCEFVEPEFTLDFLQQFGARFVQADPHKPVRLAKRLPDLVDLDVRHTPPVGVCGTVDDSAHVKSMVAQQSRKQNPLPLRKPRRSKAKGF
jgi:hypothetical protein